MIGTTLGLLLLALYVAIVTGGARMVRAREDRNVGTDTFLANLWLDAARQQSWDLGLPFPEADGTLSRSAPVTELPDPRRSAPEQVHAALHARRLAAERKVTLIDLAIKAGVVKPSTAERLTRAQLLQLLTTTSATTSAANFNHAIWDGLAETAAAFGTPSPARGESGKIGHQTREPRGEHDAQDGMMET